MNIKIKAKVSMALSKILPESTNKPVLSELGGKEVTAMTPDNIMMVVAKSEEAKEILKDFIDKDYIRDKPTLDYNATTEAEIKCIYSIEYINKILKVIECYDVSSTFLMKNDYPLSIKSTHFDFILAPRIEN